MRRLPLRCRKLCVLLGICPLLCPSVSRAQTVTPPPLTLEDALHQMSDVAGIIFVGEVTAVREKPGQQGVSGIVEIDFRIDQAVRGCTAGSTYTLREWAGLWEAGDQRYRIGQRLLMMLHAPSASGMSSPVDGMTGAIPILPSVTMASVSSTQMLASASAATPSLIADLRWIAAQLARPTPFLLSSSQVTAQTANSALTSAALEDAQQTPLPAVIRMLTSWQKALP
ncbi:MAG TPA: hypothetical protein VFS41_03140 [Edaphobacter sp.]|nr:hypothetical protein [Edaphobacter sp.]